MTDPLVSTAWLAGHLGDANVQVIDATWYMPGETGSGRADYEAAHIPGALFFDIDAVAERDTDLPHMLPTPEAFARAAGALGLKREATVVVYDGRKMFSAPRVWWTLRAMGFAKVAVLDGGLDVWRAEGRPLETGPGAVARTTLDPASRPELVRDVDAVKASLATGAAQLVDARGAPRFRGEAPEPREGVRSGHMPGARNLPWGELIEPDGRMKSPEALREAFQAAGVDPEKPVIATCGSGVTAAVLALGLARLGVEAAPVYDGSWTEWGGRRDTPVVTGA